MLSMGSFAPICLGGLGLLVVWYLLVRRFRQRHPFPIPHFLVYFIDNPLRRAIQPPAQTIERLGIKPGMRVLEIGPGSGTYTLAAARAVGEAGSLVALEIDPRIAARLRRRLEQEGVENVQVRQGDARQLEFGEASFDAVFMITVLGEIPDQGRALAGFRRVLKPGGALGLSELLLDPDFVPAERVIAACQAAGFRLLSQSGNRLHYNLTFAKG